jgi:hypothetical protein
MADPRDHSARRNAFIISGKVALLSVLFTHPLVPQVWTCGLLSVILIIATKSPFIRQGHRSGGNKSDTATDNISSDGPVVVQ